MHYSLKKVNDEVVKPISVHTLNPDEIAGYNIIPLLYANIFVVGRKGSGKTNVTFKLIKKCTDKNTKVMVFCPTVNSDPNWIKITEWLEKKKQPHELHTSI